MYTKWNRAVPVLLWVLVILGLLASLPLAYNRIRTESSAKKVEFVFDYRDLLEISDLQEQPQAYVNQQLDALKKAGIHTVAVYETTLSELTLSRRIELFNARDAALLTQKPEADMNNFTYLLFADDVSRQKLQGVIEQRFQNYGIKTQAWSAKGRPGLVIEAPYDLATLKPLGPDPMTLDTLKSKQFSVVARLSNRHQPFVEADMDQILAQFKNAGAHSVIVDGESVPGYNPNGGSSPNIDVFAKLMNRYKMELVSIELIKPPGGLNALAKSLNYAVLRGHSFSEADADKLMGNLTAQDLKSRILGVSDRFVLAVKDRNIKLVYLNARAAKNPDKAAITDPVAPLLSSLQGPDGAIPRIQKAGFQVGPSAHSFSYVHPSWSGAARILVMIGSVALIVLTLSFFAPSLALGALVIGLIGMAGLYVVKLAMLLKILALAAAICAPSMAMMIAVLKLSRREGFGDARFGFVINLFIRAVLTSLIGAFFVVGLLNDITFNLLLDQFTGVKVLGAAPLVLVGLFILLFSEGLNGREKARKIKNLLKSPISLLWVVTAGILAFALMYYISRTGNEGQVTSTEMLFRSFLENTLGIRPRTKEFLIGHPLFLLGAYLCIKYRMKGSLYIFLFGAIGLTDVVGTFTHLHTPILVSALRVAYGLLFGVVIGVVFIGIWELFTKGWRKWAEPFID